MARMVVGLGNPGPEYENTRHNAGFMVVDLLAENLRVSYWRDEAGAKVGLVRFGDDDLVLVKPQTFMNVSGKAVRKLLDAYEADAADAIVVHDDLDVRRADAHLLHAADLQVEPRQPEARKTAAQRPLVQSGIEQRAEDHVAAGARHTVEIECLHEVFFPRARSRMRCATTPAPKPLSMLTMDTPEAHELSMASSAANPPKLAP